MLETVEFLVCYMVGGFILMILGGLLWWLWTRGYYRFSLILDDFLYRNLKDPARERVYLIIGNIILMGGLAAAVAIFCRLAHFSRFEWFYLGLLGMFFGVIFFFG